MNERDIKSDRGLQILQTIFLSLLLGCGGWNLITTVETQKKIATLTETMSIRGRELDRIETEIGALHVSDNQLDRRVTTLEATTTAKRIQ